MLNPLTNPFQTTSFAKKQNSVQSFKGAHRQSAVQAQIKTLKQDQITFSGKSEDKKKAAELIKDGAKIYRLADGTFRFVDGNGKIIEATKGLQEAMQEAHIENPDLLVDIADADALDGLLEAAHGVVEMASAICAMQ